MTRQILSAGLVSLFASVAFGASGTTDLVGLKEARIAPVHVRTITIKGEGQLDLTSSTAEFAGNILRMGQYAATGVYLVDQQKLQGEMTTGHGDILAYDLWIYDHGDIHGTWPCMMDVRGITGDFTRALAEGTATVNDDGSFTFDVTGPVAPPPPTCLAAPCPGVHSMHVQGAGRIDPGPRGVTFDGQASHLGQFTAIGDLAGEQVRGIITIGPDDYFDYVVSFHVASDIHGTNPCSLGMGGNGDRYRYTQARAEGTCTVNDDDSFSFDMEGSIWEVAPPPPCLSEPCLLSY
jgi:hypothetical protein